MFDKLRLSNLLLGSATSLACIATPAAAQSAQSAPRQFTFDVPAQGLGDALLAFSRRTGLQLASSPALLKGARSQRLRGRMTAEAALARLTAGSALDGRIVGGTVLWPTSAVAVAMAKDLQAAIGPRFRAHEFRTFFHVRSRSRPGVIHAASNDFCQFKPGSFTLLHAICAGSGWRPSPQPSTLMPFAPHKGSSAVYSAPALPEPAGPIMAAPHCPTDPSTVGECRSAGRSRLKAGAERRRNGLVHSQSTRAVPDAIVGTFSLGVIMANIRQTR